MSNAWMVSPGGDVFTDVTHYGGAGPIMNPNDQNSFRSGQYRTVELSRPLEVYRCWSDPDKRTGPFFSLTPPSGPVQSVVDSALSRDFDNQATNVDRYLIPAGTTVNLGFAASQEGRDGGHIIGGGDQVFVERGLLDRLKRLT